MSVAENKKAEGNAFFKAGQLDKAVAAYTAAVEADPSMHTAYSNRSMVYFKLGKFEEAAADGKRCVAIDPTFMKGYHRAGVALEQIGTSDALKQAVGLCEKGLHHYPGNGDLVGLLSNVRARYEAMEAERKAGLVGADALKEQGNELFKSAQFEKAIEVYTRAYNACEDKTSETALKVLNNRAACNQQLSNFSAVMEDTTQVLEIEPNNMKAIIRRCLALEGMEKYRAALSDCRRGLLIDASNPILNQAQQRLGRSVRALKKASAHT